MITKETVKEFVENNSKFVTRKQLKSYPELYILKYKKNVFWDNLWNEFLVETRGTVVDEDYNVISRPFTKIFNLHENDTRIDRDEQVIAYRKINGFMASITLYKEDELLITTTGTDDSEFATLARNMIYKHCNVFDIITSLKLGQSLNANVTLIVEICSPEDPHIVPEDEGVYLLGMRINSWDAPQNVFANLKPFVYEGNCKLYGMKMPERWDGRFSDLCQEIKTCKHEGWVVYGKTVNLKMKSPYYLMAKFLARKNVDKITTLINNPHEIKKIVDEEYYDLIDYICGELKYEFINATEQGRLYLIRNYFEVANGV